MFFVDFGTRALNVASAAFALFMTTPTTYNLPTLYCNSHYDVNVFYCNVHVPGKKENPRFHEG